MDGLVVFRLISLIPDRMPRGQTGSLFTGGTFQQLEPLSRFLSWLGPLNPISKEDQQLLGVRAVAAKPLSEGDEAAGEPMELAEDDDDEAATLNPLGAGTQIAA
jgi:hypothetical protein